MKRNLIIAIVTSLLGVGIASAQTLYKCPSPTPGAPPILQQMPCSPTGGGETMTVKPIPTGAGGGGLCESETQYLNDREQQQQGTAAPSGRPGERSRKGMLRDGRHTDNLYRSNPG